jgi:hypothetical protein
MNILKIRRYEMLVRVRQFGATHPDAFPALGTQMFGAVGAAVDALHQQGAAQVSSRGAAKEATATRATARAALLQALEAISQTAHALALDDPGLDKKFRVPISRNDQRLLAAARAFADDAAPMAGAFVAHNLPASFIDDLRAGIDRLEQAIQQQTAGKEAQAAARVGIDAAIADGFTATQHLDAVVRNRFRNDPATLAAWQSARRIKPVARTQHAEPRPPSPPALPMAA